jgi:hypothetical protein
MFAERYVVLARSRIDIEIHDINFHPQHEVLFLSEIGWSSPGPFFDRFSPVFGSGFGLGALGIFQGVYAIFTLFLYTALIFLVSELQAVLSQHVDDFTLVSAFFLFVLGCINMFLGFLFRELAKSRIIH